MIAADVGAVMEIMKIKTECRILREEMPSSPQVWAFELKLTTDVQIFLKLDVGSHVSSCVG